MKKTLLVCAALSCVMTMADPFLKTKSGNWVDSFGEGEELSNLCEKGSGMLSDLNYNLVLKSGKTVVFAGGHKLIDSRYIEDEKVTEISLETEGLEWEYKISRCHNQGFDKLIEVKSEVISNKTIMQVALPNKLDQSAKKMKLNQASEDAYDRLLMKMGTICLKGKSSASSYEVLSSSFGEINKFGNDKVTIYSQEIGAEVNCNFKVK